MIQEIKLIADVLRELGGLGLWALVVYCSFLLLKTVIPYACVTYIVMRVMRAVVAGIVEVKKEKQ